MTERSRWKAPLAAAVAVTAVMTLFGYGVVAQLLATVRVDGNEITSNALVESSGSALLIGEVNPLYEDRCNYDVVPYSTGPLPGLQLDLDASDGPGQQVTREFCVFNPEGPELLVTMSAAVTADVEVGACEASEAAAGDTTCAAGAAGEIVAATQLHLTSECPPGGEQGIKETTVPLGGPGVHDVGAVGLLQYCHVTATVTVGGDALRWQTDRATFDLVVQGVPTGG